MLSRQALNLLCLPIPPPGQNCWSAVRESDALIRFCGPVAPAFALRHSLVRAERIELSRFPTDF